MKNALLLVLLVASAAVAQDVIKSIVIEPGFNVGITLDMRQVKAMGPDWTAGTMIPGQVSTPEKLAKLGLANTKAGDKVKVTFLGHDGTKEKFQVEHSGSGRTAVIRLAAEALRKK